MYEMMLSHMKQNNQKTGAQMQWEEAFKAHIKLLNKKDTAITSNEQKKQKEKEKEIVEK